MWVARATVSLAQIGVDTSTQSRTLSAETGVSLESFTALIEQCSAGACKSTHVRPASHSRSQPFSSVLTPYTLFETLKKYMHEKPEQHCIFLTLEIIRSICIHLYIYIIAVLISQRQKVRLTGVKYLTQNVITNKW